MRTQINSLTICNVTPAANYISSLRFHSSFSTWRLSGVASGQYAVSCLKWLVSEKQHHSLK